MDFTFRNMLGPAAWAAMAAVPLAIFALYFLKLRRVPLEVPSTYLWLRVIEDLHVNSLWQRLRRSLLLFLQLLIVALAILALLRPGWQGGRLTGQKFVFLIDNSASMAATDGGASNDAEGATRLEKAKQTIQTEIDKMEADMSAMVVSFSDRPNVVQEFTDKPRLLREAVERVEPTASPTSIRGALELASSFANPGAVTIEVGGQDFAVEQEEVQLYVLSDGRFGPVDGFSLGNLQPKYLPIGSAQSQNLAITALNTRSSDARPDERYAFVQIANFSDEVQTVTVYLTLDGDLIDAAEVEAPPGESQSYTFRMGLVTAGKLKATVEPPPEFRDVLPLDNVAYAVIEERRDARALLVTPGNTTLETALATDRAKRLAAIDTRSPDDLQTPELKRILQTQTYDLVLFDQCAPEEMPAANTLFIGRLPPMESWRADSSDGVVAGPQLIDWERSHPLLNLVELGNVLVVDSLIVDPPPGGQVLIDSTKGGVFAIAPRDAYEDAVLGFEIVGRDDEGNVTVNTNWPRSFGFPNFCLNVLEYLAGGAAADESSNSKPGESVELRLRDQTDAVTVTMPDGERREVDRGDDERYLFHDTQQLGIYEVSQGRETLWRFAVNLFDREESDVALRERFDEAANVKTVDSLSIGFVDVEAERTERPAREELWKWLLLASLVVLVVEWYIYNRRVYI